MLPFSDFELLRFQVPQLQDCITLLEVQASEIIRDNYILENETFSVCSVWETITGPHGMTHSEAAHIGLPSH